MLAIVQPDRLGEVQDLCARWGLHTAVIATLVEGGTLTIRHRGEVVAEVPARSLADEGPEYDRARAEPTRSDASDPSLTPFDGDPGEALMTILASPGIASKRWVWRQYDRVVQGNTVAGPDSDGAVIRVPGTLKGVVVSSDGNGRYGRLDPFLGAAHAVAEAARNVAVTGARPLAVTNCLNFGNPERPEVMWQFAESIRGMREACAALATPVTGGNVSFYNESGDSAIDPTPVIGMLGLLSDYRLRVPSAFPQAGLAIYLLGETAAELGGSEFAEVVLDETGAMPPALDLDKERALIDLLVRAAADTMLASAHDCSDGGLAVALAECAIGRGHGFATSLVTDLPAHVALFSESAARAVVSVAPVDEERFAELAAEPGVRATRIGETGGPRAVIDGVIDVTVAELAAVWEQAIPRLLGEAV
jgi:phosphoribosylformylglycinamidine synthase